MTSTTRNPHIEQAVKLCGRQQDLAAKAGCAQQTISKYLNDEIRVSAEHAVAIHRATGGAVPASALRPDLWRRPEDVPASEPAEAAE